MIEWITVICLVLFGLGLLVLEFIFIPGATIVGIMGLISCIFGIYLGYDYFGFNIGSIILGISGFVAVVTFYISLKSGFWEKFALKDVISGRVNDEFEPLIIGDVGRAITDLRPFGKGEFNDIIREVNTTGRFVEKGTKIKLVRVYGTKLIVEPLVNGKGKEKENLIKKIS